MKRPYEIQHGNNAPVHAPLIPSPFVPYHCSDNRTATVYVEVEPEVIKKYLEPTPFEYVDNIIMIYVQDFTNTDICPFWDCGIVCTARYKDIVGGYFLFEYEDKDYSIAAGRELWGYPKKYAKINLVEHIDKYVATAVKNGTEIIRMELDKTKETKGLKPDSKFLPHLLLPTVPNGDKPGIFSQRVMTRDTSPDFEVWYSKEMEATLTLRCEGLDALDEFAHGKVICGTYNTGQYHATEENGWAKLVDVII